MFFTLCGFTAANEREGFRGNTRKHSTVQCKKIYKYSLAKAPDYQLRENDMAVTQTAQACDLVIFGAKGDLARRKLLPSLYQLEKAGQIHADTRIIGVRPCRLG